MIASSSAATPLSSRRIFGSWWPLAIGFTMITVEIPLMAAIIARFPEPKVNLAAWGITFGLTLIIGSPAIMLLGTATALVKDWHSFVVLRRYMLVVLAVLTGIHALIAFTPLYYLIVVQMIGAPPEVVEPARLGLMILTPWPLGIGYRRFNYGVLIRFGHPRAVTVGVVVRLAGDICFFLLLAQFGGLTGIAVASGTMCLAVLAEAIYSWWRMRAVKAGELQAAPQTATPITARLFLDFYIPLVLTMVLRVVAQPIVSAGLSRMPHSLESLAVWPVVFGLINILTSFGGPYTEVTVVLLDEPRSYASLHRFMLYLCGGSVALMLFLGATPLAELWFIYLAALPAALVPLATAGLLLALPYPVMRVYQSWYQGILMNQRRTRSVSESVIVFLAISTAALWLGVAWGGASGLYVGIVAMLIGEAARTIWLWMRTRPSVRSVLAQQREMALQS